MRRAPEPCPDVDRLDGLLRRFRAEEAGTTQLLHELQEELEFWQREANFLRGSAPTTASRVLDHCKELQIECDLLATELVHVRMAITGTDEELADRRVRGNRFGGAFGERLPA